MEKDRVSYKDYYEKRDESYYVINESKKVKLTEYIKMGFGFYIGFSTAHLLSTVLVTLSKHNNQKN